MYVRTNLHILIAMIKQIIFAVILLLTIALLGYSFYRVYRFFKLTRPAFKIKAHGKRLNLLMTVAFGQSKIFRWPFTGLMHALVFWGFIVITIGSIEMVVDGLAGTHRAFGVLGPVYNVIIGSGDIFAAVVLIAIVIFLARRLVLNIRRFKGVELKKRSKQDAILALSFILLLMVSLLGMNAGYIGLYEGKAAFEGVYPVSDWLYGSFLSNLSSQELNLVHEVNWWAHIILIFAFANVLPYSKHFHVFTSLPNVYLSRLNPVGKMNTMEEVKLEVEMMMNPEAAHDSPSEELASFGISDAEHITWKNYLDSLSCTQCGRCTSVCPANQTGKILSPRKIMVDTRARMKERGPQLVKQGVDANDGKMLINNFITEEELWACTSCNACVIECPININQLELILEMRRYLVLEQAKAPGDLSTMLTNIENNGAPWQYSAEDRMKWSEELYMNA
mgnify:CR=1 FL=1